MTHLCPPIEPSSEPKHVSLYSTRLAYITAACRISLLCNVAFVLVLTVLSCWTYGVYRASLSRPPLVVGFDPASGAARVLSPETLRFRPTDETLRHFLLHFVREHCERTADVSRDYGHSLLFMDRRLAGAGIEQDIKQIKQWQTGEGDEVRVKVLNMTLEDVASGCRDGSPPHPCRAKIDYEKTFYNRHNDRLVTTKAYAADVTFVLKSEITNDMVEDNPLGLIITDFHEFEGF